MLRLLVLTLLLANVAYYAWSEGMLRSMGLAPVQQRESHRLAQQLQPEALRLLSPAELKKVEALAQADLAPKVCLQAGPFSTEQAAALGKALASSLADGTWRMDPVTIPARWIIYMGKFPSPEALVKKRGELAAMQITPQPVNNPALEPGLALAGFATQAAAMEELARLNQRGIRTARVVQETVQAPGMQLQLPAVSEAMKAGLGDIKPALGGKVLRACS